MVRCKGVCGHAIQHCDQLVAGLWSDSRPDLDREGVAAGGAVKVVRPGGALHLDRTARQAGLGSEEGLGGV